MWRVLPSLAVTSLLIFSVPSIGYGQAGLPMPSHYVEDYANVLAASDEASLNGILQELEQKTGAQYIVLTVQSTEGVAIDQYAIELAEKWKLGQAGKDNGMLFVIAVGDKKYRFEVGYGLEGFITDAYCGRVGREVLKPYLKKGDYSKGILQATATIAQRIAKEYGVTLSGMPKLRSVPGGRVRRGVPCCGLLPFLLLFLIFFGMSPARRSRQS